MKHIGTQQFETERLICRKFNSNDYENMFENWAANPNIQLEYGEPVYDTIQKVQELLNTLILTAIWIITDGQLLKKQVIKI